MYIYTVGEKHDESKKGNMFLIIDCFPFHPGLLWIKQDCLSKLRKKR